MKAGEILAAIGRQGVVPVLAIDQPERAVDLADALSAGGFSVLEVTFRTGAAVEAMRRLRHERPEALVGAGTVLDVENAELARESGARFLVSPGLNPAVVRRAAELGLPMIPGVLTPSEIEEALRLGCRLLKLFPAEVGGGVRLIQALSGPYGHTGVRFVPTGGVNAGNLAEYLKVRTVLAVGGTWIAKREDLAAQRWEEITARCREAAAIVSRVRQGAAGPAV